MPVRKVSPYVPTIIRGSDFIAILDTYGEVMYWTEQEWLDEPELLDDIKTACLAILAVGDTRHYRKRWQRPPNYDTEWGTTVDLICTTNIIKVRNYKNMMEHLATSPVTQLS
jgi:hypothetical protein